MDRREALAVKSTDCSAEDLGTVLGTHIKQLIHTPFLGHPRASSGLCRYQSSGLHCFRCYIYGWKPLTDLAFWMIPGQNQSWVSEFILIGFSSDPTTNSILFIVFLLIYLSSVLGNGLIIMLVCLDTQLTLPCTSSSLPSPCWI